MKYSINKTLLSLIALCLMPGSVFAANHTFFPMLVNHIKQGLYRNCTDLLPPLEQAYRAEMKKIEYQEIRPAGNTFAAIAGFGILMNADTLFPIYDNVDSLTQGPNVLAFSVAAVATILGSSRIMAGTLTKIQNKKIEWRLGEMRTIISQNPYKDDSRFSLRKINALTTHMKQEIDQLPVGANVNTTGLFNTYEKINEILENKSEENKNN